jgi:hypothetical protein
MIESARRSPDRTRRGPDRSNIIANEFIWAPLGESQANENYEAPMVRGPRAKRGGHGAQGEVPVQP